MTVTTEPVVLTVVYEPCERGWVQARVPECPEIVTCGPDHDEARAMVADALRELLLSCTVPVGAAEGEPGEQRETLVVTITAGPSPATAD